MKATPWSRARSFALAVAGTGALLGLAVVAAPAGAAAPRVASLNYTCKTILGNQTFPVTVTGATPKSVAPNAAVSMTGTQVSVTIPAALVTAVLDLHLGSTVSGHATTLDVNSSDAKSPTVNAAKTPIPFGPLTLVAGHALVLRLPAKGLTVGTWAAKAKGTMIFTPSTAVLSITIGKQTNSVSCSPQASKTSTISVTSVT